MPLARTDCTPTYGSRPPDPELEDDLARVARAAVLCNEGRLSRRNEEWTWRGDPTDIAFLALGQKLGWDRDTALQKDPQVDEIQFEPECRFSATFHEEDVAYEAEAATDLEFDEESAGGGGITLAMTTTDSSQPKRSRYDSPIEFCPH